ncbi:hypothetical protein EAG_16046 [Camponotus floridanus]|uniref:Uncharacterized protein n=1 Tax=Camponotus floridanus TaxID=104421 RepID=E2ALD3_CAMFO|nr:hypothetical protein EAG_16046 [Camponotus floridanus]
MATRAHVTKPAGDAQAQSSNGVEPKPIHDREAYVRYLISANRSQTFPSHGAFFSWNSELSNLRGSEDAFRNVSQVEAGGVEESREERRKEMSMIDVLYVKHVAPIQLIKYAVDKLTLLDVIEVLYFRKTFMRDNYNLFSERSYTIIISRTSNVSGETRERKDVCGGPDIKTLNYIQGLAVFRDKMEGYVNMWKKYRINALTRFVAEEDGRNPKTGLTLKTVLLVLSRTYDTDIALYFTAYGYETSQERWIKRPGRQILQCEKFKITNVMINRLKIHECDGKQIKDSHHRYPIIVIVSFGARKIVIRIFGSVGDAPHTIHEEVLRKVDCPALNVRARCAPSSSACTSVPNTRGAIYFRCRYFRIKNPGKEANE